MADVLVLDFNSLQIFKVRMTCYDHQVLLAPQHKRDQIGNIRLNIRSLLIQKKSKYQNHTPSYLEVFLLPYLYKDTFSFTG